MTATAPSWPSDIEQGERVRSRVRRPVQRFWSTLAVQAGKHAGLVSVIGLLITLTLGAGISKLEFATGQDSYLNKSDQVYKDNVAYQGLFGGEAMLTLITMDKGHSVEELLEPKNRQAVDGTIKQLRDSKKLLGVVGPTTVLDFSGKLVQGTTGNPLEAPAALAVNSAIARAPKADKA